MAAGCTGSCLGCRIDSRRHCNVTRSDKERGRAGHKEDGTKNVETKEASNESKEAGDENGEAQTVDQAGADKQQSEEAQTGAESDNFRLAMRMMTAIMR